MAALASMLMAIKTSITSHRNDYTNPSSSSSLNNSLQLKLLFNRSPPANLVPQLSHSSPASTVTFARRRSNTHSAAITSTSASSKRKSKKILTRNDAVEENLDEDAFEALFKKLEEDLKNDPSLEDIDEELSEEDLALLERELEEAFGGDGGDLLGLLNSTSDYVDSDNDPKEEVADKDNEDDDEIKPVTLKNWQLKRLAYALKSGRRKTSIKTLAAELCLDRVVVLEYLRDPPPNLLLMSAALPDKPAPVIAEPEPEPEPEPMEVIHEVASADATKPEGNGKLPVHCMQSQWSSQKRLKKVQVETLERVYRRSKRPTNAMVSSIVQVTNLPRKRVVKWFEDKRSEDGVPDKHSPYQRSSSETVFSS